MTTRLPPRTDTPPPLPRPAAPRPLPHDVRDRALGHALYALGDSALTEDGHLRPRVWEMAEDIGAYITDGIALDRQHCGRHWYRGVLDADADMPPDTHTCTRWQADHPGAHRCCCGDTEEDA